MTNVGQQQVVASGGGLLDSAHSQKPIGTWPGVNDYALLEAGGQLFTHNPGHHVWPAASWERRNDAYRLCREATHRLRAGWPSDKAQTHRKAGCQKNSA